QIGDFLVRTSNKMSKHDDRTIFGRQPQESAFDLTAALSGFGHVERRLAARDVRAERLLLTPAAHGIEAFVHENAVHPTEESVSGVEGGQPLVGFHERVL